MTTDSNAESTEPTDTMRGPTPMDLPIEDVVELGQLCATYAVKLTQGDIHYVIEHVQRLRRDLQPR